MTLPPYIFVPEGPEKALAEAIASAAPDRLFIFSDRRAASTGEAVGRLFPQATRIDFDASEENKSLAQAERIWRALSDGGATRRSIIINIGGGITTDLGGFAAALFKRGIRYINVPTTLLAAVDASIGGKTAVNFAGLKNEIGAFADPLTSVISPTAFRTLPAAEWYAGFAEMLKTAYISEPEIPATFADPERLRADGAALAPLLEKALEFKLRITREDPREAGLRRILNFGHTAGHAFESLSIERSRPLTHGAAVAHGILVALILSHFHLGLPSIEAQRYASGFLRPNYPALAIDCRDYDRLLTLMAHDKKNDRPDAVSFVLLRAIGSPEPGCQIEAASITAALDIYRDLTL